MESILNAIQYLNNLQHIKRSGPTLFAGIKTEDVQSVAEHSFITAYMCLIFGNMLDDIDEKKVAAEGMIHDWGEGITGDWPTGSPSYKSYFEEDIRKVVKKAEQKALETILSDLKMELPELSEEERKLLQFSDLYARIIETIELKQKGYTHRWVMQMFEVQLDLMNDFDYDFIPELKRLTQDLFDRGYLDNIYLMKATRK